MSAATSKDGTRVGFTRAGAGTPLILVDGALSYRKMGVNGALAELLAEHFTVFTYDRCGRGETSDREGLDPRPRARGPASLARGGGRERSRLRHLVRRCHRAGGRPRPGIAKLALFELPFVVDDTRPPIPVDLARQCQELVETDRRGAAVKLFMKTGVRVPAAFVALMQLMPAWPKLKGLAHTLPYDLTALGSDTGSGKPLPAERWASLTVPTLVVAGGKSPAWMQNAMRALAEALPNARHRTLEGQTHIVKAKALAPVLAEFFAS